MENVVNFAKRIKLILVNFPLSSWAKMWYVMHGRKSLVRTLRLPGKKLSFMGNEFGQFIEWNFRQGLDWLLLDYDMHHKMLGYTRDLNRFYLDNPCLWVDDGSWNGYQWVQPDDPDNGIYSACFHIPPMSVTIFKRTVPRKTATE